MTEWETLRRLAVSEGKELTTQGESTPTSSFDSVAASKRSLLWGPFLAIAATSVAVEAPSFFLGTPSGHDFEFHLYSWLEVLAQWKRGIVYPRWASMAHWAYGEPRFVFYPPASWTVGAALSALLPWTIISGVYIWLALVAAGVSMFMLARTWLDRRDALGNSEALAPGARARNAILCTAVTGTRPLVQRLTGAASSPRK